VNVEQMMEIKKHIWVSGVILGHAGDIRVWQTNNAIRRFCACTLSLSLSLGPGVSHVKRQALITPSLFNNLTSPSTISILPNTPTSNQNDRISTTQAVYGGTEIEEVD
jgi:hypothetical protein